MDVSEFWRILEASQADARPDQLARLQASLERLDETQRSGFTACFTALMRYACDWGLWDASAIAYRGMDSRTFFGVRAWLISRGREVYEDVLARPDALSRQDVGVFFELAELVGGQETDLAKLSLRASDFTGAAVEDDDDARRAAFPALFERYCNFRATEAAKGRWLFSRRERTEFAWKARAGAGVAVALCGLALWSLPWWGAILACVGSLAAAATLLLEVAKRRDVGAFAGRARSIGNARTLVGDIDVAIVHARRVGSAQVRSAAERTISEAFSFLTAEAQRHGVQLRFRRTPPDPIALETPALRCHASYDYDPESIDWLERSVEPLTPPGNGFALVITSEWGCTGIARRATRFSPSGVEFCLCPDNASAATIAHEVLHLFGAHDLYPLQRPGGRTHTDIARDVAAFIEEVTGEDIRETSVMGLHMHGTGTELRVDPANAFAVGWTQRVAGRFVPKYR